MICFSGNPRGCLRPNFIRMHSLRRLNVLVNKKCRREEKKKTFNCPKMTYYITFSLSIDPLRQLRASGTRKSMNRLVECGMFSFFLRVTRSCKVRMDIDGIFPHSLISKENVFGCRLCCRQKHKPIYSINLLVYNLPRV